jgi:hypothetical protein
MLCPLLMLAASCTATPQNDFCLIAKDIRISKRDVLTDATVLKILEHRRKGQELCGW